ncbi:phosphoenolpyruvate--protein phosphotransferase [Pseudomonas protegens]|uniref:phosphoenolpyruvate--protein phosphotransferase n=2 Tax=Pseudomonas protegens TaxID=380021 RepID=Q4K6X2_PSEF5|nr:phosphoenolpyruvate--protein phosphotransferase [Pseudomonas protegens]AAY94160.1 phosphotransferase system, glucose-specific EI/HPr/EIIA component [Pseudomonas protegens Pf-5]ASE21666.1 phosphoenolpyruvate--protein phosphotransferase [Pseudomonas protegens]QEZ54651.1 phosphoenolpyruvate--protein phosphotransferase [Pseudomonas protegens]QEZ59150.1 phosphoenolpyruvate--protein phosphotransferase [Pseudomonas protegens]QEZ65939.1 phosphoenolpyruvate--protein phosphotransferase [Pseudomonas p
MAITQPLQLLAPLSGVLLPLDQVPDPVFSSRVIGDGVCIDPTSQTLCAPLSGVISNLQRSGHAVSITGEQGQQVLMHIGLDTVNLAGKGFTCLVEEGQQVSAGQPLIEFDADYLARHARSLLTLMLVVSGEAVTGLVSGSLLVELGQPVLQIEPACAEEGAKVEGAEAEALFSKPLILGNPQGLHARPAALLAQAAKGFAANICLHRRQDSANAKSLVSIMALQTVQGDVLQVSAAGADAERAIQVLVELLVSGCGEKISPAASSPEPVAARDESQETVLRGVCASPGSAVGQVLQVAERRLQISELAANPQQEREVLERALREAVRGLQQLRDNAPGEAQQEIFRAHQELLDDPSLLQQTEALIVTGKSAAFAWNSAIEVTAELFKGLGSTLLAERAVDLADVGQRVLKLILGVQEHALSLPDQAILIAEQLTPSQTASLDTAKVLGFATVGGGATSHVAILARALGLPAICGLSPRVLSLANGTRVLLDADRGELHTDPDPQRLQQLEALRQQQRLRQRQDLAQAAQPAVTRDGHHLEVTANIASLAEAEQAMSLGGEGVGLLRSEFLYQDRSHAPSPEEQAETYRAIAQALGPERNLVVRTLDVGGDKPLAYVPMDSEANPFLGLRGIRLCLERPELLREQFRAILASAGQARLHIMLPMVSQLAELRQARQLLDDEVRALGLEERPKLGIMIEVPSAALMADRFAPEVDFFSIGTNDLTQYTLAMDRDHPRLASQADSFHPSVLRLIARTVQAAHAHGKWVGVCGALASETLAVPLLLGLGVDELSVSVPLIPAIKARVRELDLSECQALAARIIDLEDAVQVREYLHKQQVAADSLVLEN